VIGDHVTGVHIARTTINRNSPITNSPTHQRFTDR
jgi:hypothetical protein